MSMTVKNIIDAVRERLDEVQASQWTDLSLKRWLNEGLRDLGRKTKHIKDTTTFTTVAGQAEYTLAAGILEVEMAFYATGDGRQVNLTARSFAGMNAVWGQYRDQAGGDPAMFTLWGVPPNLKFRLFPAPGSSGKTVTVYVSRLPATITEDNTIDLTVVDLPDAWVDLMKDYVEYCAKRKDGNPAWQEAQGLYNQHLDDMIVGSDYSNTSEDMIADPLMAGGVAPRWLVDTGW